MSEQVCVTGCRVFSYGETMHCADCPFYPETFSKMYHDSLSRVQRLEAEIAELKEERDVLANAYSGVLLMNTELKQANKDLHHEMHLLIKQGHRLRETQAKLVSALEDFSKQGTRHDTTPTGMFKSCGCFDSFDGTNWQSYIKSQDKFVRDQATQALASLNLGEEKE